MDCSNPYGEHGGFCNCGEWFDKRDLADVFKHEHAGLPLDDVMGIKGKRVEQCLVVGNGHQGGFDCPKCAETR